MRSAIITGLLLISTSAIAATHDLSGKWALPGGGEAKIAQQEDGSARIIAQVAVDEAPIKVTLTGTVAYVKLGSEGGLVLNGSSKTLRIKWEGRQCIVKDLKMAVHGEVVEKKRSREYHALGSLYGPVFCSGKNTHKRWVVDLTGTWK